MKTELVLYAKLKEKVQSLSSILHLHTYVNKLGRKLALPLEDILTIALFGQETQIETKKKVYELLELETDCP
jgi:hypothetical protein